MKTWSYKSITKSAEAQIRRLMDQSQAATDGFERHLRHDWAYGVFLGWKSLTAGWTTDGDVERLEALTDYRFTETEGEGAEVVLNAGV